MLGRGLTDHETRQLSRYLALLSQWQRAHRLVGSTDPIWLIENVVLDSLLFLKLLPEGPLSVADLGSGAGVPGIPIKIVRPELTMLLIEARARRASFLAAVIRELELRECRVVSERAEDLDHAERDHDAVVMRCAGDFTEVLPVAASLARAGGLVITSGPPKGSAAPRQQESTWVEVAGVHGPRRFSVYRKPVEPGAS